ncbi:copper chaperone PCu(A)C [Chitinibacter tainanensis]|uniref:copper chaperone PCu(A)C n=1 Tax=Chitinibacter tainanensis TaxID=230667 RepID=UPI002354727B|nr:copper chaperone PCu(A)C [Chitinibacter tainanensis]
MLKAAFAGAALLCATTLSYAHGFTVGDLTIQHPWARATAPAAKNAGAFMLIKTTKDDQLVKVDSDIAEKTELHEMKMADGVMKMSPIASLPVTVAAPAKLAPGGYHVMLLGLKRPLVAGEKFPLKLTFAKGGVVEVQVKVEDMTYQPKGDAHSGH